MWRLIRAQFSGRWQWRLAVALLVGIGAALFEWFYEGRAPSQWAVPVPLALIVGAITASLLSSADAAEHRAALLKSLPVSTTAIAFATALLPLLMFLPIVVATVLLAQVSGALGGVTEHSAVWVFSVVLCAFLSKGPLWSELKPRLAALPYGMLVHYGLPLVIGGGLGAYGSIKIGLLEAETPAEALLRWMSPGVGYGAAVLVLLMSSATVALFLRRDAYVD